MTQTEVCTGGGAFDVSCVPLVSGQPCGTELRVTTCASSQVRTAIFNKSIEIVKLTVGKGDLFNVARLGRVKGLQRLSSHLK